MNQARTVFGPIARQLVRGEKLETFIVERSIRMIHALETRLANSDIRGADTMFIWERDGGARPRSAPIRGTRKPKTAVHLKRGSSLAEWQEICRAPWMPRVGVAKEA